MKTQPAKHSSVDIHSQPRTLGLGSPKGVRPPPDFRKVVWKIQTLALDNARDDVVFPIQGNVVHVRSTTNVTDRIDIRFNPESDKVPFFNGDFIGGTPFTQLKITNAAIAGATVIIAYCTDYSEFQRVRIL